MGPGWIVIGILALGLGFGGAFVAYNVIYDIPYVQNAWAAMFPPEPTLPPMSENCLKVHSQVQVQLVLKNFSIPDLTHLDCFGCSTVRPYMFLESTIDYTRDEDDYSLREICNDCNLQLSLGLDTEDGHDFAASHTFWFSPSMNQSNMITPDQKVMLEFTYKDVKKERLFDRSTKNLIVVGGNAFRNHGHYSQYVFFLNEKKGIVAGQTSHTRHLFQKYGMMFEMDITIKGLSVYSYRTCY